MTNDQNLVKGAKSQTKSGSMLNVVLLILFLAALAGFAWSFWRYWSLKQEVRFLSTTQGQQELNKKEIDKVVEAVGKLIILPTDQQPTVATIQDAAALAKEQPFFDGAENGDKLLLFSDKAIIYSVKNDKLVNVGPVYNQDGQAAKPAENLTNKLTVDVRNGSEKVGVGRVLADDLISKGLCQIKEVTNAVKTSYPKTILVNLTNKDVSALEKELGVKAVKKLPEGEAPSAADALIIVGNL